MAERDQPVVRLDSGAELRPWHESDAHALVAAGQDPAISLWSLLTVPNPDQARERIAQLAKGPWSTVVPDGGTEVTLSVSTGVLRTH